MHTCAFDVAMAQVTLRHQWITNVRYQTMLDVTATQKCRTLLRLSTIHPEHRLRIHKSAEQLHFTVHAPYYRGTACRYRRLSICGTTSTQLPSRRNSNVTISMVIHLYKQRSSAFRGKRASSTLLYQLTLAVFLTRSSRSSRTHRHQLPCSYLKRRLSGPLQSKHS